MSHTPLRQSPASCSDETNQVYCRPELAFELLSSLEIAIFRRHAPWQYSLYGQIPNFYKDLFNEIKDDKPVPSPAPWRISPMLEVFLTDAEIFFESGGKEHIQSGIWLEEGPDGEEYPLVAYARSFGHWQVITIHCIVEAYNERVRILRQARQELIKHRVVSNELVVAKKRVQFDALTRIYNRGGLMEILRNRIGSERRAAASLAVLMIDIDDFKKINDTYGHLKGDFVLTNLAHVLEDSIRKEDVAARYGGEEFAVLCPGANLEQARLVGEKLRECVQAFDFDLNKPVTISVGCTTYKAGESIEEFLHRADMALYSAKHSGKNQVCANTPE